MMRQRILALIAMLSFGCTLASASASVETRPAAPPSTATAEATQPATEPAAPVSDVARELLDRINRLRASLNLPAYTYNQVLSAAAQDQAQWMVTTGMVAHIHPDGSTPAVRAAKAGYAESWTCSEIIYMGGIATLDDAWGFWMTSKVHYAEITSGLHREAGIGLAHSDAAGQAFVVVFGGFTLPTPAAVSPGSYVVQPGDTLYLLAQRYG